MVPQITQWAGDRADGRRRRAETSVRRASHRSADQPWKRARILHAIATLANTQEHRAALDARADRVEGLAWDKALRRATREAA